MSAPHDPNSNNITEYSETNTNDSNFNNQTTKNQINVITQEKNCNHDNNIVNNDTDAMKSSSISRNNGENNSSTLQQTNAVTREKINNKITASKR